MSDLLKSGQTVHTECSQTPCTVEQLLGGGGQGEVYRAKLDGQPIALKWYYSHSLQADPRQRERLEAAIQSGAPSERFLWPIDIVSEPGIEGFGYVMPLRDPQYRSFADLMKRRDIDPTFRTLANIGFQLADSFFQLHIKGLCYCDISHNNVFFNPNTGGILICDNDNVTTNGESEGISGTQSYMAPEIVRGEAQPSTQTDLYSLAVLLFITLMNNHPLEGKKEVAIRVFDQPARNMLYGTAPVFIFDPNDESNRPDSKVHVNALAFWPNYPQFLRDRFTKAFTNGIYDPSNGRVHEAEWRQAMVRLRDSIVYCPHCGAENFYDADFLKASGGKPNPCWKCQGDIRIPPRIRIDKNIIMLNHNTKLFPHHIDNEKSFDFSKPVAEVNQHPTNPNIWGLKNLSSEKWVATSDGKVKEVEPNRSVIIAIGTKINFGKVEGEIRL